MRMTVVTSAVTSRVMTVDTCDAGQVWYPDVSYDARLQLHCVTLGGKMANDDPQSPAAATTKGWLVPVLACLTHS